MKINLSYWVSTISSVRIPAQIYSQLNAFIMLNFGAAMLPTLLGDFLGVLVCLLLLNPIFLLETPSMLFISFVLLLPNFNSSSLLLIPLAVSVPSSSVIPTFSLSSHRSFTATHGLGVKAIALEVENAGLAFSISVSHGAKPVSEPVILNDEVVLAEVHLYGDVVLRFVSFVKDSNIFVFLPSFELVEGTQLDYGIRRLDHAVGNVPELGPVVEYIKSFTGFHEFAEFTAEDVGTAESGLNSIVLANNDETVLFPLNEPVYGTKRKSQIQTYLEHNEGAGVQHLALATEDIFTTLREIRKRSGIGGFEFMPSPPPMYYKNLKSRAGDTLSDEQIRNVKNWEFWWIGMIRGLCFGYSQSL